MITKMFPEGFADLDPGIRFAVKVLRARGFDTCQSCQGGEGHAYDRPTVDVLSASGGAEGFGALAALVDYGLPVSTVALLWSVDPSGLPFERVWRITFSRPMPERADEEPMFVWGYEPAVKGEHSAELSTRGG